MYINGAVLLHVEKRYRIITANWIVLWGWSLGTWWIPIRSLYLKKKQPQNYKEADGTNLDIMKCPLLYTHHFFSLDWVEHDFFNLIILKDAMSRWKEISLWQVIRWKRKKVKIGLSHFTCSQGYSNKWRTDKILIITP